MRIIVSGRCTGKTNAILEWMRAAEGGERRVCVCPSAQEAERLRRENRDIDPSLFVGPNAIRDGALEGAGAITVAFDNLDIWLRGMCRYPIEIVTLTGRAEGERLMVDGEIMPPGTVGRRIDR
jgi:hypothetical protein